MKLIAHLFLAAALAAPAFSSFAQEAKPAAGAASQAKAEPAKAAKPDLAKGEASFGAVCAACHAVGLSPLFVDTACIAIPLALPHAPSAQFASAMAALGQKPPIS